MTRKLRINPLNVASYGAGVDGTILVVKRFGSAETFIVTQPVDEVATVLKGVRGLFPGFVEFDLAARTRGD